MTRASLSLPQLSEGKRQEPDDALARKVAFLRNPSAYPGTPAVTAIETHMSWVFLAGDHAYKLKKPVRYEFLDFSTLEARRVNCDAELRLNRRLAPGVYLEVIPLMQPRPGEYSLSDEGTVVDWLVKMRRLPADATLEQAVVTRSVREEDVRRLIAHLAAFYGSAERIETDPLGYPLRIEEDIRATHAELRRPEFVLGSAIESVEAALTRFIANNRRVLEGRAVKLVEGHGDLRPEHIYLTTPPVIIDCIEFNREFRVIDPVDELSYLALECERLGAGSLSEWIFRSYRELASDPYPETLVRFYKAYRAFVRAKVAIWHLRDDNLVNPRKWRDRCEDYLRLAEANLG